VNITYSWLGDPNLDTCWVNITALDASHNIVHYIQNRSITSAEYSVNNTWWYDWDTTGLSQGGPYHINITVTDPYDLFRNSSQQGVFWLNISIYQWSNVELWNITLVNNTFTWKQVEDWNLTLVNGTFTWKQVEDWNLTLVNNTFTWRNITDWNLTICNLTEEWVSILDWNLTLHNILLYTSLEDWNLTLVNSSVIFFTITKVYPSNNSNNIPLQPYVFATINYTGSESSFNVSWYNSSGLIGKDTGLVNGTHNELFINATDRSTSYTLWIRCNDGNPSSWENQSFSFRTEGYPGGGVGMIQRFDYGILGVLLGVFGIISFLIIWLYIKKRGENDI